MTLPTWKIHVAYILIGLLIALGSYISVKSWSTEHDLRVKAEATVKQDESNVATLQQQITARDAVAAKQQQVIVKVVHDTVTPAQAVEAMPGVVNVPLSKPVTLDVTGDMVIPAPDVLPIFQQLADDKVCRLQLDATAKDLTDTKAIVTAKDNEITVLKKKPKFFKRVENTLKIVGVTAAIVALLLH